MTESSRQTSRVCRILASDLARPKAASSFALKWSAQIGGTAMWTDESRSESELWPQLCAVSGPYITTDRSELSLMGLPASAALICIQIRGNESEVFAHGEKQHNNSGQSMFKFRFLKSNRFQSHKLELDTTYQIIIKGSWFKKTKEKGKIIFSTHK